MKDNVKGGANSFLGTEPISSLLVKYAVPSIVAMLVTSLYNIVDQIFIGWGVGFLGNGATTVMFPVITLALALALLVGNGSSAFISLEMGKGNMDNVRKTLGNGFFLMLVLGVVLTAGCLLGLEPLLKLCGATPENLPYAKEYGIWIILGFTFNMVNGGFANVIRADGSPTFSMLTTLAGCLLNIVLDPIFIFVFDMGVAGAAIATVISQIVSCGMTLYYFIFKGKNIRLTPGSIRPSGFITRKVLALGSSSFITQAAIAIMNMVLNNSLTYYGALSPYGKNIPLSAMGIVLKINAILISIILGVAIGAQPILGYNYGAKNYRRVRRTYFTVVGITGALSTMVWIVFMTMPHMVVSLFGDSDPMFNQFAALCLTTFLAAVFAAGFQIPSANFFQAIGKPLKAMTLSMSRQLLFLIPSILLLGYLYGLMGILYAGPVADLSAMVVTGSFILWELRQLNRLIKEQEAVPGVDLSKPEEA